MCYFEEKCICFINYFDVEHGSMRDQIINPVRWYACSKATELAVHVGPEPDIIDPALNSAVDEAILVHTLKD